MVYLCVLDFIIVFDNLQIAFDSDTVMRKSGSEKNLCIFPTFSSVV